MPTPSPANLNNSSVNPYSRWWLTAAILPWLISSLLLLANAVNAPRLDDFDALFTWFAQWQAASGWREHLAVLLADYQNHRWALVKLPLLFSQSINFQYYAYTSPLLLALAVIGVYVSFAGHRLRWPLTLLASLCLCHLQVWLQALWAPIASAMLILLVAGLWSAWLVFQSRYWLLGLALAVSLCFVHAGGTLMLLALALVTGWQHWRGALSRTQTLTIGGVAALALVLYFGIFPPHSNSGYSSFAAADLAQRAGSQLSALLANSLRIMGNLYWRDTIDHSTGLRWALIIGALEATIIAVAILSGRWRKLPALWVWLLGSAAICASIAAGRGLTIGAEQMLQNHYRLISSIGLWVALASAMLLAANSRYYRATRNICLAVAAICYLWGLYWHYPAMRQQQQALWQDVCQWQAQYHAGEPAQLREASTVLYTKQPNKKIKAAYESGFYRPDCRAD